MILRKSILKLKVSSDFFGLKLLKIFIKSLEVMGDKKKLELFGMLRYLIKLLVSVFSIDESDFFSNINKVSIEFVCN